MNPRNPVKVNKDYLGIRSGIRSLSNKNFDCDFIRCSSVEQYLMGGRHFGCWTEKDENTDIITFAHVCFIVFWKPQETQTRVFVEVNHSLYSYAIDKNLCSFIIISKNNHMIKCGFLLWSPKEPLLKKIIKCVFFGLLRNHLKRPTPLPLCVRSEMLCMVYDLLSSSAISSAMKNMNA